MASITDIRQAKVADLTPYAKNARTHSEAQVQQIAESIKAFRFLTPVLIDGAGNLIAGHGRILAAKLLGMETVPAVLIEGLTEEQRRAYILADNRLTELGGWDTQLVQDELAALSFAGFDVALTGFSFEPETKTALDLDLDTETAGAGDDSGETISCPKCGFIWKR